MSVNNISTTAYGNTVAANAAKAAGTEGGQSIEAQIMSVMAMGYDTNVKIMKNQVQAYRAQLKLQQSYNDTLAKLETYKAGFKGTDTSAIRQESTLSADGQKKIQSAIEKASPGTKTNHNISSYTDLINNTTGLSETDKRAALERAAMADQAKALGLSENGQNQDFSAFVKGDVTQGFVDGMKTKIKGAMDAIGADLQLAMIDIQTVKGRMDQMMTAMTQMAKSTADKGESIARNL